MNEHGCGRLYLLGTQSGRYARGGGVPDISVSGGGSMRLIMDWAQPDSFQVQLPMGQTGNPFSPHYDDFLGLFERDHWWTVPFPRAAVEANATSRLRLSP